MVKVSIGVMVVAVLFTLSMCKCGWAFETTPTHEQETIVGETTGEGETQTLGGGPGIGDQTPAPHPDKTKEKHAVSTGNSGAMVIIPNSASGQQYPLPVLAPEQAH